jgi:hypothetical protein
MSFSDSKFGSAVEKGVSAFLTLGLVSALIKLGTSDTGPTPDQKTAIAAEEATDKAEIAKQDLQKQEAIMEEQRRRSAPSP